MALTIQRSDLITFLRNNYFEKLDTVTTNRINRNIENGLRRVSRQRDWSFLETLTKINAIAPYSTGTVAINHGSTTVTGTTTVFPADSVGAYIEFNGEDGWYEITVRGGDTSLTILDNYSNIAGSNLSGASYKIVYPLYNLPANFRRKSGIFDPGRRRWLRYADSTSLWWVHAGRAGAGQPEAYGFTPLRHDPNITRLLLYPAPSAIENYEMVYWRHAGWYSTDTPATSTFKLKATADTDYIDWPDDMLDLLYAAILLELYEEIGHEKQGMAMSRYFQLYEQAAADDQENGEIRQLGTSSGRGHVQRYFIDAS
jgi:hypothetical protein